MARALITGATAGIGNAFAKELAARVHEAKAASEAKTAEYEELLSSIENLIIDGVPTGGEDDFVVLKEVGTPRPCVKHSFLVKNVEELALTNPDELTPRAAHELIYRWKQQLQNPKP